MTKMNYFQQLKNFQSKIESYANQIMKCYGHELLLRLEEYNLLTNPNNCLQSSTAFGYIIEEFLVSKLEIFTQDHNNITEFKVCRHQGSTTASSYDCFSYLDHKKVFAMINIKACKHRGSNNAIAAITPLYNDFVLSEPDQQKCYLILKVFYDINVSRRDNQRKIFIENISSFFLDEIDFSMGHQQDQRNWSSRFNPNSGRLIVSNVFLAEHRIPDEKISYQTTCKMLEYIQESNKNKKR